MMKFKKRNFAQITNSLATMCADLCTLVDEMEMEAERLDAKITELAEQRYGVIVERTNALEASKNIKALIG